MSVSPHLQAALDAPLREGPSAEDAEARFTFAREADDGWPPGSLFGAALGRLVDRWHERDRQFRAGDTPW